MKKYLVFIYTLIGFVAFAQKTHTVAKGDTPYNISKKYGVTLDELTKLNPQIKEGKLAIGDVLIITKKNSEVVKTTEKAVANTNQKLGKILLYGMMMDRVCHLFSLPFKPCQ